MRSMKLLFAAVFLLAGTAVASAQGCGGQFRPGTFCGNSGASLALPGPVSLTPAVLAPIAGGTVIGNPTGATAAPIATPTPVLGIPGSVQGSIGLAGITSGTATIKAQAAAGTPTLTLPNTSGTFAAGASSPLALSATTGNLTCPTCVTSSGGGAITGVAPVSVSAAGAVSITGLAGGILAGAGPAFTATPVLGVPTSLQGTLGFAGVTSGTATVTAQATAGTPTLTLPNTSGTFAVNASAPLSLSATTGALTCSTCATSTLNTAALTSANDTNVTVTLGGSPSTALLNAASITMGWSGQLALTRGGTNASLTASNGGIFYSTASAGAILSGTATANLPLLSASSAAPTWATVSYPTSATSGGVAYFSSSSAMASSGLLTQNGVVLGGGSGGAPTSTAAGTANQLLIGQTGAAPVWTTNLTLPGTLTAASLSTSGTIGGSLCATSAGLVLYESGINCFSATATSITVGTTTVLSGTTGYLLYNNGGTLGNETIASVLTAGQGIGVTGTTNATIAVSLSSSSNILGADVSLNTSTYSDGPSVAQGATGTWYVSGHVTLIGGSASVSNPNCKLWDGTTVLDSGIIGTSNGSIGQIALHGVLSSPAGNLRISCKGNASGDTIKFNSSGNSKDSTIYVLRIG